MYTKLNASIVILYTRILLYVFHRFLRLLLTIILHFNSVVVAELNLMPIYHVHAFS